MQKYKRGKRISQGAFGTVYETQLVNLDSNQSPLQLAMKQMFSSSHNVVRQLEILKKLPEHPNLIRIYDIYEENMGVNIVMDRGKFDLLKWLNSIQYPVQEKYVKAVAVSILQGLKQIHKLGFIHRDLKPSNILIMKDSSTLAICDFGSAVKSLQADKSKQQYEIQGFTRWYKPPQMLFGDRKYSYEVDIWSLGCILMEVAIGEPFFCGKSQLQQIALIAQTLGSPTPQNWPSIEKLADYGKITFKKKDPLSIDEISQKRCLNRQLVEFIMQMIRYENRKSIEDLLNSTYLKGFKPEEATFDLGHIKRK